MKHRGALGSIVCGVMVLLGASGVNVRAHDGPPFPIVSGRTVGPYEIAVWTDPDTTDDRSPGGQFWVVVEPAAGARQLPSSTRVSISAWPLDRRGPVRAGRATPTGSDASRQFVAILLDHEGRFAVRAEIDGPMGRAEVDAEVEATYDLRPPPIMVAVYLVPFILVGALWFKLLLRRRGSRRSRHS